MDVDPRLRELLQREADRAVLPDRLHREVLRRARVRRRVTAALATVLIAGVALGGIAGIEGLRSLIRSQTVGPASGADHPDATGPEILVAGGTVYGHTWSLVAYPSDAGLCVDLQVLQGSGSGCGWSVPHKDDLGLSEGTQQGLSATSIHGVLSKRVAAIEARLEGGRVIPVDIVEGPPAFDVNFFAAFLPPKAKGMIVAMNAKGDILQSQRLRLAEVRREPFIEEVIDQHKITVYYPQGWQRAQSQLAPGPGPEEILSLGTYPLRPGADECPQIPEAALEDLQPGGAFLSLRESKSGDGFRPRPKTFSSEQGAEPEWIGCLGNRAGLFVRELRFSHEGRFFNAIVAWSTSATGKTMDELWGILDNLLVCDPSSKPGDCL